MPASCCRNSLIAELRRQTMAMRRLGASSPGERAAAAELALEGLYLTKRISKVVGEDGQSVYG